MSRTKQKKENDDPIIWVDQRVESYKQFFDYKWGGQINDLTESAPKLNRLTYKLAAAWKIASNTAMMPWLMNNSLRIVVNRFNGSRDAQERMAVMCQKLTMYLMRVLPLDGPQKLIVADELGKAATRMRDTQIPPEKLELSPEWVWDHFIGNKDFNMSLWGSQYQAFTAVYLPYDNFLGKVVRIASGKQGLKVGTCDKLEAAFAETFGADFAKQFVMDRPIHEARLVRHAIAHNGGEETDDLRTFKHHYRCPRHQLQIYPEDVKQLFDLLKGKVKSLSERCVTMKEFGYKP